MRTGRHTILPRPVQRHSLDLLTQSLLQVVTIRGHPGMLIFLHRHTHQTRRFPKPHNVWNILGPTATTILLSPTPDERLKANSLPQIERPNSLGSMKLVSTFLLQVLIHYQANKIYLMLNLLKLCLFLNKVQCFFLYLFFEFFYFYLQNLSKRPFHFLLSTDCWNFNFFKINVIDFYFITHSHNICRSWNYHWITICIRIFNTFFSYI